MAVDAHKNFSYSTVATAPSPATSGTSLVVTAGEGALFPAVPFNATIWPTGSNPISTNAEIVRVTAISTDTLTIVRAQESSSARTVIVGDQIAATITAKTLTDAEAPAESQVTFTDITTNNVSTTKHGFAPKGSANNFDFLDGTGAYSQQLDYSLLAYSLLGGAIKAQPLGGNISNISGASALIDQQIKFNCVYLPKAATITGVKWFQAVQGAYTASNYNGIGVYSIIAGTLTLQASSTNDGNIWKSAVGIQSKAFSGTVALGVGVYFIAFLYCRSAETTAPSLGITANTTSSTAQLGDFSNSVKLSSLLATQTAFPSPTQVMSGLTSSSIQTFGGLY